MNVLKLLFGSPDAAMKTAGQLAKGVDNLIYTDQEKEGNRLKAMEWLDKYMESTQGQNLARRYIAVIVTIEWALLINIGIFCGLLASPLVDVAGVQTQPDAWKARADFVFKVLNECVNEAFMAILAFYFLSRVGMELVGKLKGK